MSSLRRFYCNWESVAILYEESIFVFLTAYNVLVEQLPKVFPQGKIAYAAPVSDFGLPLSSIIDQHLREILVMSTWGVAHKIMCLIQKRYQQLTFPTYQFVFVGVRYSQFHRPADFTLNHQHYMCSVDEITQVMEGFLLTHFKLDSDNSTEIVSGKTYAEYLQQYHVRANGSITKWANPVYDGVWSLALALNNSIPRLNEIGIDIADYAYGQKKATDIIREEVVKLSFVGASGHISFHKNNGYATASISLDQVVDNDSFLVGYYSEEREQLLKVRDAKFIESSFKSKELVVHPALASLFLLLIAVVLVLIASMHTLTLIYSNFPSIRASSSRLGQLAFIGCYMIALCSLCYTVQKVVPSTTVDTASLCVIQAWSLPLGLTLILGTVTAKTWRLYHIFVQLKRPGKLLQDKMLIVIVLTLAAVDVILCSVWSGTFKFTTSNRERFTKNYEIEVKVECYSEHYYSWFGALLLYEGSIMASALILAILTKNIRSERFKTKSVIFLVYFLTIALCLGFPLYFSLNATQITMINAEYAVLSLTYLTVVYLCLIFMFFPPILPLLRVKCFHKLPGLSKYSKNVSTKPALFMLQN